IEMRQIGARQEAGRIGGIGSCGRELCCSVFITNFTSVTTSHAKYQELTLNPQKLAGQCGKLKCCLNYEFDCYIDAQKNFPPRDIPLELASFTLYFQKMEVHKSIYWYSRDPSSAVNLAAIPVERVREIQELNKKGVKPEYLFSTDELWETEPVSKDLLANDSITRFDKDHPQRHDQNHKNFYRRKGKKHHDRKKN
ncbi:MAG: regulatory iron-sulfur-containing complex subunit RicT, partial [Bacteroidales bacterium]